MPTGIVPLASRVATCQSASCCLPKGRSAGYSGTVSWPVRCAAACRSVHAADFKLQDANLKISDSEHAHCRWQRFRKKALPSPQAKSTARIASAIIQVQGLRASDCKCTGSFTRRNTQLPTLPGSAPCSARRPGPGSLPLPVPVCTPGSLHVRGAVTVLVLSRPCRARKGLRSEVHRCTEH